MIEAELTHLIERHPNRLTLPAACVKAVCWVESAFDEWAVRYEPEYRWLFGDQLTLTATERTMQKTSFGLMQVMGAVAREAGWNGSLAQLCSPVVGLKFGMLHLNKFYAKYHDWPDALSSYNAGSPRKGPNGKLLNQHYVDKVLQAWASYETSIPLKESEAMEGG